MIERKFFRISFQTILDNWKIFLSLTVIFSIIAIMFASIYPSFQTNPQLEQLIEEWNYIHAITRSRSGFFSLSGFLNLQFYQIFWVLILGFLVGFISVTTMTREIEQKTVDILMANPISRRQLIIEKYLGLIPFIFLINLIVMITVYFTSLSINEEILLNNIMLTHFFSIFYFLAIASIGFFLSILIKNKIRAGILTIATILSMYFIETYDILSSNEPYIGYISIIHYFNPADTLIKGIFDSTSLIVLILISIIFLALSIIYFEYKDMLTN